MNRFTALLAIGDLRSIGKSKMVIAKVKTQNDFDELFENLFHKDRSVVMRTADAIEKISSTTPLYLQSHRSEIIKLCSSAANKELKWHLAQLLPRLALNENEFNNAWQLMKKWATDPGNSRIVGVNSLKALFQITKMKPELLKKLYGIIDQVKKENIPSLQARIKKIQRAIE
jgi:hypothetical protein